VILRLAGLGGLHQELDCQAQRIVPHDVGECPDQTGAGIGQGLAANEEMQIQERRMKRSRPVGRADATAPVGWMSDRAGSSERLSAHERNESRSLLA
jgi:hypothetical protein